MKNLLIILFSLLIPLGTVAQEAYAVLNDGTLTFYYDNQKGKRSGTSYELNTGENSPGWSVNSTSITKAVFDASFVDARPTTTYRWFRGAKNMKSIEGIKNLNTSKVTNMGSMFSDCDGLTNLDLSSFNTSNVTSMSEMFYNCSSLTSLDLSNFNTSNVTYMNGMFSECSGLMSLDLSNFNTRNVTTMFRMFDGCEGMRSLGVSNFNTSNVTTMFRMFAACRGLTSLDLSSFNTSNVTNMDFMFAACRGLTSLDLSCFNTSNLTGMNGMFYNCSGLTSLNLSSFNTSKVAHMREMFYGCSGLTSLDLSCFNTSNVWDTHGMFYGCSSLITIYCSDQWTTDNVFLSEEMFSGCTNLVGGAGTSFSSSHTYIIYAHVDGGPSNPGYLTLKGAEPAEKEAYAVFTDDGILTFYYDNQKSKRSGTIYGLNTGTNEPGWYDNSASITKAVFDASFADARPTTTYSWFNGQSKQSKLKSIEGIKNLNTSNVTNMGRMFRYCSSLTSLDLSSFNTSNVTNMDEMFHRCSGLTSLDVSSFNTSNVTDMYDMFSSCSGLTSIDLSCFNTSNVTSMVGMFANCSGLASIDVSSFNTSNVTSMLEMFSGCSGLTSIDLSSFNNSNVTDMRWMFSGCSSLTTIYCSDLWTTDKVTSSSEMFHNCTNLIGGAGTTYNSNYTDKSYAHVDGGPSNPGYLTLKGGEVVDGDDLQRYLDSLIDTEDEFVNNVYRRVFLNDDWQALYVPFEMNYSDWADRFEVASIQGFYWYDDDDDNYVDRQELVATKVESGSLQANFPYLIRAKAKTGATLTVNVTGDVSQQITVASMELPSVTYYFTGNYSQLTGLMSGLCYRLQGGSLFIPLSDSEVLLPYRWYMTMDVASTQSVRLNIVANDETTGIENVKKSQWMIQSTQLSPQQPTVFDLSGRRVDADIKSLPKGIYIINNKKRIIK